MGPGPPRGELMALLADVKDNPREDGLRLILADWLEECGGPLDQPRADLIRAQIDVARLPADDPARSEAGRLAWALRQRHGKAWLGPLVDRLRKWNFDRGLLSVVATKSALGARSMMALAGTEAWAWVEELFLADCDDADLSALGESPLLTQLVSFGFQNSHLGPAGAQSLGGIPWLRRLEHLDLSKQMIGDRGLKALLASPHLARLPGLALAGCGLTFAAAEVLAGASLPLERLTLWGNALGDRGPAVLCAGGLPTLRQLDLRVTGMGDEGARGLAACPGLAGLHELDLADNQIGPAGALALAHAPALHSIRSLVLWGNPVGAGAAGLLQERFGSRVHVSPVPS